MVIKQLSVFLENREGRIEKVTETLAKNEINIASLSLADTSQYGMLRMIVSNPEKARKVLKEEGFSSMLTEVLAVKLPQKIGVLHNLLALLVDKDISVEYMYTLATGEDAAIIVKLSDASNAVKLLVECGYELYRAEEACQINQQ